MEILKKFVLFGLPVLAAYCYFGCDHFDPESLRGKRVLVTGASSGIGEEVALKYAKLGTQLVITARRKDLLEKVAEKCKQAGAKKVFLVVADMELPGDRKKVVDASLKELGGLDFLVLNHAIIDYSFWKGTAQNMSKFETYHKVNFISFVDLTSQFLKALEKSKGRVVVVSSILGKSALMGTAIYSSTKHALHGFYSALRQELKFRNTGISVTLVVYGFINTKKALDTMENVPFIFDVMSLAGDAVEAADVLIEAASARKYEVYYPTTATIAVWLNRLFPLFMEDLQQQLPQHGAIF